LLDQQRKITAVIEMRMGQQNRVDLPGIERETFPVAQAQYLEALKKPAIDQQTVIRTFNEIFGAGYGPGPAQEGQFEIQGWPPHDRAGWSGNSFAPRVFRSIMRFPPSGLM
jgi:hypothetical protein